MVCVFMAFRRLLKQTRADMQQRKTIWRKIKIKKRFLMYVKSLIIVEMFSKIYPFLLQDYNRVVLEKIDGVADSDYINASRVDVRELNQAHLLQN